MNRLLPPDIRILALAETSPEFHPRHSAVRKTYEYRLFRGEICPPFERRYVYHYPYPLNEAEMVRLAPVFEGEHDFTAFAASDERDALGASKIRIIYSSRFERQPDRMVYRVTGNGFLKHMVRNMMGTLLEVGRENLNEAALRNFLHPGRRDKAGPAVPGRGLFLVRVEYDEAALSERLPE